MSYEPKLRLTITLPGSVMMSEQECSENPKKNYENIVIKIFNRKTKSTDTVYVNKIRGSKTIKQSINISEEAYQEMIGACPVWEKPGDWKKFSITQKLKSHFYVLTEQLGGISFSFEFLEN